jgi:hypothetical protein
MCGVGHSKHRGGLRTVLPEGIARFLRIAAGSLHETKSHLRDVLDRRYLSPERHEHVLRLTLRAIKANTRLTAYLLTSTAPEPSLGKHGPGDPETG